MLKPTQTIDPMIRLYFPAWHHHHGAKMAVEQFDLENCLLVISGSAAKVTIKKSSSEFPGSDGWLIDWEIVQSRPRRIGSHGRTIFSDEELAAAFGLSDLSGNFGNWLIEQYGADSAEQGKYIRWKNFLNIPCPGTGHDGDPNISIEIRDTTRDAVKKLLKLE